MKNYAGRGGGDDADAGNTARINKGPHEHGTKRKWDFLQQADNNGPKIYGPSCSCCCNNPSSHASPTEGYVLQHATREHTRATW
jgi:hypothetical protein